MIEISIPSKSSVNQTECYSLASTDFDSYKILPPSGSFKGGINDDVLIYFFDLKEMEDYSTYLGIERNIPNSMECRTQKLQRIIDSIGLRHPLEFMKARFFDKSFKEVQSGLPYRFIGTTLNISNEPYSEYKIIELNRDFFLESGLDNEPLKITIDIGTDIATFRRSSGKEVISLQPEQDLDNK